MAKIKFTKGELKKQRDALRQYERYLPTLQLKKQQLQLEVLTQLAVLQQREHSIASKKKAITVWSGLLGEGVASVRPLLEFTRRVTGTKNIAGVDYPVFERLEFQPAIYDLFLLPLWLDAAVVQLRELVSLGVELGVIQEAIAVLRQELRVTTQRVNLFEKVKIPQAKDAIRLIKIFIGDQMANAVGRSKIAKRKIEAEFLEEVAA